MMLRSQQKRCGYSFNLREFTRPTVCGLLASFVPERERGLSLWLYPVETVMIAAIHHGRINHYFCVILAVCGIFTSFVLERGRGLSLWLYPVETVIIAAIHHGRMNHYFCVILAERIPHKPWSSTFIKNRKNRRNLTFITSPVVTRSSVNFTDYVWMTAAFPALLE